MKPELVSLNSILDALKAHANPANVEGMARFGITPQGTLGVSMPFLRSLARKTGKNHELAGKLWRSGIREARILTSMVAEPALVSESEMEAWVSDFDSWDVCDQVCMNCFRYTKFAYEKAKAWSGRPEEFVKRAAFTLMATLAVSDKKAADDKFLRFLSLVARECRDERNYVKKAVNWALRQIGKRNRALHRSAVSRAREMAAFPSPAARWIARDALRELQSEAVRQRIKSR